MTRRMALAVAGRPPRWTRDPETEPRGFLFEDMFVTHYHEAALDGAALGKLSRRVPSWARLAMEIRRRQDEYDVVVTWNERVSLALMTLDRLLGPAKPHVAMMYWFSRPSVRYVMRACGPSIRAVVTWSSVQRTYAIEELGFDPRKIYLIHHYVDQVYWRPRDSQTDTICSAGAENRDYPTLVEALRGTDIPCHIASDHVRVDRLGFARRQGLEGHLSTSGAKITVGRKAFGELRELYARSRFVVVPLQASDTDNGVTVILEAMAMGKAVICSRTRGQVDVIQEGVTGLFVPVGDATALRQAILQLWNDPARAHAMGRAGREYIEKFHTLEGFCREAKDAIDASLDGRAATVEGAISTGRPSAGMARAPETGV